MATLKAVLWDVDGTLAETERDGHRVAFNLAFEACGVPWRWDEAHYGELLRVTGGRERLMHDMNSRSDAPSFAERDALARALHTKKNAYYAELVQGGGIPLRPGVLALMQQCRERGVRMGVATTTSRSNLDALLRVHLGERWAEQFAVTVCGEDVQRKKPDPEVYLAALRALDIGPLEAVAILRAHELALEEFGRRDVDLEGALLADLLVAFRLRLHGGRNEFDRLLHRQVRERLGR